MLLLVTLLLAVVGVIMVFSASAPMAEIKFHDAGYFLKRQLVWLCAGLLLMHVVSRTDYSLWRTIPIPLLALTAVLLLLVLIPDLVTVTKGARRWFHIGSISLQPAELTKFVLIMYVAAYISTKQDQLADFARGSLPPLIILGVLSALILLEPDLGTVVLMSVVVMTLLFLSGARLKHLAFVSLGLVPVVAALLYGSSYRWHRILEFWRGTSNPSGPGYQVMQSLIAFGSGGTFGVGLGNGQQKLFYLPEPHTDFIFAVIGEELGLIGTVGIIFLYALLMFKGFQIAGRARTPFGYYLATGITMLIGTQALINVAVVTGLLPTKGVTLPFVSYGGSSLLANMFGIGMLLSISRDRLGGHEIGFPRRQKRDQGLLAYQSQRDTYPGLTVAPSLVARSSSFPRPSDTSLRILIIPAFTICHTSHSSFLPALFSARSFPFKSSWPSCF
ncbi:MAG: putative lipid II flippase FtsW [Nitrospiraceae bacterium]